ncbi:MAG: hypothetical protein CVV32_06885 [Methanomicrobiales archaeon HGW-Methanomicrobiales-3]|jgi:hypothetical protein|nr:MAG: hypothetical protein CVV32_06885 [Methanomicrobiales archaeon HGW-Methanomicrobiales-3]
MIAPSCRMKTSAVLSGIPMDRPQAITAPLENTGLPSCVVVVNSGIAPFILRGDWHIQAFTKKAFNGA